MLNFCLENEIDVHSIHHLSEYRYRCAGSLVYEPKLQEQIR